MFLAEMLVIAALNSVEEELEESIGNFIRLHRSLGIVPLERPVIHAEKGQDTHAGMLYVPIASLYTLV